jgi:beta-glucosidase/6-phospho-beta-glucosidase/beta-galactosidase
MNIQIFSGIEPTKLCRSEVDVLKTTEHDIRYREDFELARSIGITTLRLPAPWHRIEKVKGIYDWTWMDEYMQTAKDLGIQPILDPFHHCSYNEEHIKWGFLDDDFVRKYIDFFCTLVDRYPWVNDYTIINEPTATAHFSCSVGIWPPYAIGQYEEATRRLKQVIKALGSYLEIKGKRHWYVDAINPETSPHRFDFVQWLVNNGVKIDILGLDYYPHCDEMDNPIGFYTIAKEYYDRFKIPLSLTETNVRGYISDRQTWFVRMYKDYLRLKQDGIPIIGFCWYPLIDSKDWASLLQECNNHLDPVGIFYLDENNNRIPNEFSNNIGLLNSGKIKIEDVDTYNYLPPLDETLKKFK